MVEAEEIVLTVYSLDFLSVGSYWRVLQPHCSLFHNHIRCRHWNKQASK